MSYLLNNQQRFNDVIFENRNKNYGAYAIRSAYGNTVFKSLLLVTLSSFSIAALAYFVTRTDEVPPVPIFEQIVPQETVTIFENEPTPPEPAAAHPSQPPAPTPANASAIGTVVSDTAAVDTRSQSTVEDPQPIASTFSTTGNSEPGLTGPGNGTTTGVPGPGDPVIGDPFEDFGVDSPAEFEGGVNALLRFVSSRLRYPETAVIREKEGIVYVKFVVDEKGKVGNIILRNNLGFGLDEEARRVVSMIPDFKSPAKIKGKPVKVYYSLPIRFKMR